MGGCLMFLAPQRSTKQQKQQKNMVVGVHQMMGWICRPRGLESQSPPPSLWTPLVPFNKVQPPPLLVARPQFNARRFFQQHFTLSASEAIIRSTSVGNVLKQLMRNHAEGGALLETMLTMFEEGQ